MESAGTAFEITNLKFQIANFGNLRLKSAILFRSFEIAAVSSAIEIGYENVGVN